MTRPTVISTLILCSMLLLPFLFAATTTAQADVVIN